MNAYATKYEKEAYNDFLIDTSLSTVSACASGAAMFYSGGTASALFVVGAAADHTSAVKNNDPYQIAPTYVSLIGKYGKISAFLGSMYNWFRGVSNQDE